VSAASVPLWRRVARGVLAVPGIRLLRQGWPDEGRRIVQSPHLQALLDRAAGRAGRFRRVFNAGSGEGGYSQLLLALPGVESVLESDFSYQRYQPTRLDPKQAFFGASLTSIPLADATVDLVLCTEVLEHIQEDGDALDEIARVMTPGGWLVMTVPTPPAVPDPAHVREGYRAEDLARMLVDRGFAVAETRFCMHFFFRWILSNWPRLPWSPRILIRTAAGLDRLLPIGPPMDLMILAQRSRQ
jgi:SAM-dependent methyltransferase